jgi:hypothetical protein
MAPLSETIWVVLVMSTTVGYGDLAPKTTVGRMLCIGSTIWGVGTISLFIVST